MRKGAAASSGPHPWGTWALVAGFMLIVLAWCWLRLYRIGEPIGGFHSFNEGFYARLAALDAKRGVMEWLTSPIDLNNPPLYSLVVSLLLRAFSTSPSLMARLVSVVSGLAVCGLTFEVGRLLYSRSVGAVAAAFMLLLPGAVLVSRNAQTDMLALALAMLALTAYVHAMRGGPSERRFAAVAGVSLGLGFITKLPVALVVPAVALCETVACRGVRWLARPRVRWALGTALASAGPWYVYRAFSNAVAMNASQSAIAGVAEWPTRDTVIRMLMVEPMWMIGVLTLISVVFGAIAIVYRPKKGDLLVGVELLTVVAFIVIYHFHAYYWTPALPFFALLAARGVDLVSGRGPMRLTAVLVPLMLGLALSSGVMLSGQKWAQWSIASLDPVVTGINAGTVLDIGAGIYDSNLGPVAELLLPDGSFFREGSKTPTDARRVVALRPASPDAPVERYLPTQLVSPVVFGRAVWQSPPNFNFYENGPWRIDRIGPWWWCGITVIDTRVPLVLTDAAGNFVAAQ